MVNLLTQHSPRHTNTQHANILLKDHQLAMLYKCQEIERQSQFVIMSDSPGTGKSYVVLANILFEKITTGKTQNLIVIPYNLHTQWINYIKTYSKYLNL